MARVSTYLNFMGQTEEALAFYAKAFGTELQGPIARMGAFPLPEGAPALSDADSNLVMHAELPILAGHVLMATDMLESLGHSLTVGNNVTINLEPDSRAEADALYEALADGGSEGTPMQETFWGYWGTTLDRFGIRWMFNCSE